MGLSIAVTFLSAVTIITYPAELYQFGTVIAWFVFVSIVPTYLSCLYYLPIFMRLQISSIFEVELNNMLALSDDTISRCNPGLK